MSKADEKSGTKEVGKYNKKDRPRTKIGGGKYQKNGKAKSK